MVQIRGNFELDHLDTALIRDIIDENLQSFIQALHQDPTPILRTPDHMIFSGIHARLKPGALRPILVMTDMRQHPGSLDFIVGLI